MSEGVDVELFAAAGDQVAHCGHVVRRGDRLVELRVGNVAACCCATCFADLGRQGSLLDDVHPLRPRWAG